MQKLAILGGSFNPIHWGHLLMAETALSQCGLDQIIWVPTHYPPYKAQADLLSFHHRLAMIQQAIAHNSAFAVSAIEQNRQQPSYAIDTLLDLQDRYPHSQWAWIVGLDAFRSLPRWYRHQDLIPQCQWLVAPRMQSSQMGDRTKHANNSDGNHDLWQCCRDVAQTLADQGIKAQWQILDMPLVAISSSLVRQYHRDHRSIRYLVPDAVRDYILVHRLYSQSA